MKRSRLLPVLAALSLLIAWWIGTLLSSSPDETEAASPEESVRAERVEEPPDSLPHPLPSANDSMNPEHVPGLEIVASPDNSPVTEVASDPGEDRITVVGTILVVDADGREHHRERGSFTPILWKGSTGYHAPAVEIVNGSFEFEALKGARMDVQGLVLGGRAATLQGEKEIVVDPGHRLALRAKWPKRLTLRVIDADSGMDLAAIELVRCSDWMAEDNEHPGDYPAEDVVRSASDSPLELAADECRGGRGMFGQDNAVFWARAPGYGWGRIEIDMEVDGERTLSLRPEAQLLVRLLNYDSTAGGADPGAPSMQPILRIRSHEEARRNPNPDLEEIVRELEDLPANRFSGGVRPSAKEVTAMTTMPKRQFANPLHGAPLLEQSPDASGATLLSGLAPGKVDVSVEVGDWFEDSRILLGWTTVLLEAGRRAEVALKLDPLPTYEPAAPFAGTLLVPTSWNGATNFEFYLEQLDLPDVGYENSIRVRRSDMEPVAGIAGFYRWSAGDVIPGRYEIEFPEFQYQQVITVPAEGVLDARIEIGERADVVVYVLEQDCGEPASVEDVHWTCERPAEVGGGGLKSAKYDAAIGGYRFVAPAGRVRIQVRAEAYGLYNRMHELHPGGNEVTVGLIKSCGLVVSVQEGDQPVPYDLIEAQIHIEEFDGTGHARSWSPRHRTTRIGVSNPGLYEIRVDDIDGYLPNEPVLVQVPPGEWIEHVVILRRVK